MAPQLIEENNGHKIEAGKSAGRIVNEYKIFEDNGNKYVEMMTSNKDNKTPFYFDYEDLDKIEKLTSKSGNRPSWYLAKTGETIKGRDLNYIACKIKVDTGEQKVFYLHAFLMNHMGNGRGSESVDHIDQDPLNNRQSNLRIVSQSIQNENRVKKSRPKNARPLPEGITEEEVPIYVIPYLNSSNGKGSVRNYWTIEHHPALKKELFLNYQGEKMNAWKSESKNHMSMRDKLKQAIETKELMDLLVKENRTYCEPQKVYIRKQKVERPQEIKDVEHLKPDCAYWVYRPVKSKGVNTGKYKWKLEIKSHEAIKQGLLKNKKGGSRKSICTSEKETVSPLYKINEAKKIIAEMDLLFGYWNEWNNNNLKTINELIQKRKRIN